MHMQLKAITRAQIFDKNRHQSTIDDLFDECLNSIHSVFEQNLLSDQGKDIARAHDADYDTQPEYKESFKCYNSSTKVSLISSA